MEVAAAGVDVAGIDTGVGVAVGVAGVEVAGSDSGAELCPETGEAGVGAAHPLTTRASAIEAADMARIVVRVNAGFILRPPLEFPYRSYL